MKRADLVHREEGTGNVVDEVILFSSPPEGERERPAFESHRTFYLTRRAARMATATVNSITLGMARARQPINILWLSD